MTTDELVLKHQQENYYLIYYIKLKLKQTVIELILWFQVDGLQEFVWINSEL